MAAHSTSRSGRGAQELLAEFQQTGKEEPFREIARRYAGMVYSVALRVTKDAHDAEDATQATFLALAVHAKTAGKIRYVGPWLRRVSQRLALDIRRSRKRRRARELVHAGNNGNGQSLPASSGLDLEELRQILRQELDKLPAKYRLPLILYYFGGLSPEELSRELRCNTSTLGVRLHRGRKMLAEALTRRGFAISAAMVAGLLAGLVDASVKDNLAYVACSTANQFASGVLMLQGQTAAQIAQLLRVARSAAIWGRLKIATATVAILAGTIAGAAQILHRSGLLDINALWKFDLRGMVRPLLDRLAPGTGLRVQTDTWQPRSESPKPLASVSPGMGRDWPLAAPLFDTEPPTLLKPARNTNSPPAGAGGWRWPVKPYQPLIQPPAVAPVWSSFTIRQPIVAPPLSPAPAVMGAPTPALRPLSLSPPTPATPSVMIVDLAAANSAGQAGQFTHSRGTLRTDRLIIGDQTQGRFFHRGGTVRARRQVVLGNKSGSSGTYTISGQATLITPKLIVGKAGSGTVEQSSGTVAIVTADHDGELVLAEEKSAVGRYSLKGGVLQADRAIVGVAGSGTIEQTGGQAVVSTVQLGQQPGAAGTWDLRGGVLDIATPPISIATNPQPVAIAAPLPPPDPMIVVGGDGSGMMVLNPEPSVSVSVATEKPEQAVIRQMPEGPGGKLLIRSSERGQGTVLGWGRLELKGPIIQNGQVVADGFGTDRELDLSRVSLVTNTIENPPTGGTNGWFARGGASLLLPPIDVAESTAYTWGEDSADNVIDLVNSVRFTPNNLTQPGQVNITLLDPSDDDVPPLPAGIQTLALWRMESTARFDSVSLVVRYDDSLASLLQVPDDRLALWAYENGQWRMIDDDSFGIDPEDKLIWGTASSPSYFATASRWWSRPLTPSEISAMRIMRPASVTITELDVSAAILQPDIPEVVPSIPFQPPDSAGVDPDPPTSADPLSTPEPSTWTLFAVLGAGALLSRRRT